jgi:hypothetical protein
MKYSNNFQPLSAFVSTSIQVEYKCPTEVNVMRNVCFAVYIVENMKRERILFSTSRVMREKLLMYFMEFIS